MTSFTPSTERVLIAGPAGTLEIVVNAPDTARRGIALIAHPNPQQGGTLDNKVAQTLAKAFHALDYVAVRFNFRGVGASQGSFDDGDGECEDALAALDYARDRFGRRLPYALGGFSFGAYVQTRVAQRVEAERLVLAGPAVKRFEVATVPADTIVIHGEQDDTVPLASVFDWARPQELPVIVIPGADHFFHRKLHLIKQLVVNAWDR